MSWTSRYRRHHGQLVFFLSVVVLVLLLAVLIDAGIVSARALTANKDLIDVLSTLASFGLLLVGAVLAYFRFFRGRTLSPRLDLEINCSVFEATPAEHLHVLSIEVVNIGPVAIWEPRPIVEVIRHSGGGSRSEVISEWFTPKLTPDGIERIAVLDTGESAQFFTQELITTEIKVVTYFAHVSTERGAVWSKAITVGNIPGSNEKKAASA